MPTAIKSLGRAGQIGYVIQEGQEVTVTNATNIPGGGFFVALKGFPENSIYLGEDELEDFVDMEGELSYSDDDYDPEPMGGDDFERQYDDYNEYWDEGPQW